MERRRIGRICGNATSVSYTHLEEIENLKNYIIIQKLRYGDVFETVYNIDDNVRSCAILKFLLQPIAENSILHAFEEDREHQILTIREMCIRDSICRAYSM